MRLERKLARWTEAGLISAEQAARILQAEDGRRAGSKWVVWALASVGGLAVIAGIISLVAANWDEIPDKVKLAGGLGLLLSLALTAREVGERNDGWIRDLLLLLHQGMVLAMIGLVAQVYHLSGHPWRPFALAFVLALPAVVVGRRGVLADVALVFAVLALGFYLDELHLLERLAETGQLAFVSIALGLPLALAVGPLGARAWGEPYAAVARRWALALVGVPLVVAAFMWSLKSGRRDPPLDPGGGWLAQHWPLVLFVAAAAGAVIQQRRKLDLPAAGVGLLGALLVLGGVFPPPWTELARRIAGFALCCGVATLFTFAAAARGSRAGVNLGTLALAARILAVFLELFDTLTRTGLGLIATGVLLVGIAYGWWRVRVLVPVVGARSDGPPLPRPPPSGAGGAS